PEARAALPRPAVGLLAQAGGGLDPGARALPERAAGRGARRGALLRPRPRGFRPAAKDPGHRAPAALRLRPRPGRGGAGNGANLGAPPRRDPRDRGVRPPGAGRDALPARPARRGARVSLFEDDDPVPAETVGTATKPWFSPSRLR